MSAICFEEFVEQIKENMNENLSKGEKLVVNKILKNNGILLTGINIQSKQCNVSPTVYLDEYYHMYNDGLDIEVISERIRDVFREHSPENSQDMSFFKDFERVKENIAFRLINIEKNTLLLEDVPHIDFMDLAVVFYYSFSEADEEKLDFLRGDKYSASILIHNSHMEMWNVDTSVLYETAKNNMPRLFPVYSSSITDILSEMLNDNSVNLTSIDEFDDLNLERECPMYVITNTAKRYGAAAMLYPEEIEKLSDKLCSDLFIIPSSVHEIILVPDMGNHDGKSLSEMVHEVNITQVPPEDVLSDNVYYYSRSRNNISILDVD